MRDNAITRGSLRTHPRRAAAVRSTQTKHTRRRATIYVLVLATAAIATAAGLGGLYVQRTRLRTAQSVADVDAARVLAASGLELAMARVKADPNWRTSIGAGSWLDQANLGPGTLSVSVVDPADANLANAPADPFRIISTARVGQARQVLAADVNVSTTSFTVLQCAAYGQTNVYAELTTVNADAPVASGAGMTALVCTFNAPAQAVGLVNGVTYLRGAASGAAARTLPASADVLSTYAAGAQAISYVALPSGLIERTVLGASVMGMGASSTPVGVFVIDCNNRPLRLRNARIYGTLLVLNCTQLSIEDSVRIDPLTPGHPSVIVQGPIRFQTSTTALSEATHNTNFNPVGAPWQGVTDTDKTDTYASGLTGIVYATGDIMVDGDLTMVGTLIARGSLTIRRPLNITHEAAVLSSPPPAFWTPSLVLSGTGVRRSVD